MYFSCLCMIYFKKKKLSWYDLFILLGWCSQIPTTELLAFFHILASVKWKTFVTIEDLTFCNDILQDFQLYWCIFSCTVRGFAAVDLKIVFLPLVTFEIIILIDNFR